MTAPADVEPVLDEINRTARQVRRADSGVTHTLVRTSVRPEGRAFQTRCGADLIMTTSGAVILTTRKVTCQHCGA